MKEKKWRNNNHMLFESEHKTFNRQVQCISTGNVLGYCQLSGYVRAKNDLKCNGFTNPPGHLQNWDLTSGILRDFHPMVKEWIRENVIDKHVIAYQFRSWNGERKVVHGYVITTADDEYKLLKTWHIGPTMKSWSVIDEAIKYITN